MKDGIQLANEMQATLSFSSIMLSDAGQYTCGVTAEGTKYTTVEEITITSNNCRSIASIQLIYIIINNFWLSVPSPTSVTITSVPLSPIRPVGSDVTVTCAVNSSPMVDIQVTVVTEWTGPAGFVTANTAQPVVGNTTLYTSTVIISSFSRDNSGIYTCRATISSTTRNPFVRDSVTLSSYRVTVGEIIVNLATAWGSYVMTD